MKEYTREECEYIVMNPLIQEGMEPTYLWTLMGELILTFPNLEEYKDGIRVLARDLIEWENLWSMDCRNKQLSIWLSLGK